MRPSWSRWLDGRMSALGVGAALAQQTVEVLERAGYLNSVVQGCLVPCQRCPLHAACLSSNGPRIWY
jgi:hypothetical protein